MICSQDKQKCEGVQWVRVPAQSELKDMVKMLAELHDENHAYHKSMKRLMGDLVEVMGDIAQSQQVLVGRVVPVNLLSEEGTPSDMPLVLGDNPLWQEFWEWRQWKYWLTDW
jgi:hypothetical protein